MAKRFARRSWGWYLVLLDRKHFKVKLLWFRRDYACSHQLHRYRGELWLFLKGEGKFYRGGGFFPIKAGDNVLVPVGHAHYYLAISPTLVLEIQYGERCEEGDIVRV